jgi:MFS transporter, DHA1 family, inner membrane transport protein
VAVIFEHTDTASLEDAKINPGIGRAIVPTTAIVAIITIGCVALLMMGIQPLALGALQSAGRLTVPQMGVAATAETLALGAISALMAAHIAPRNLKVWTLTGCILLLAANAASCRAEGISLEVARGIAGMAGGIIVWVAIVLIVRRPGAARVNAIFLGAQALTQSAAAIAIPKLVAQNFGANSSLVVMGALSVLVMPLVVLIPSELPAMSKTASNKSKLRPASLVGLAVVFAVMAGIVGLWVYVEPIAEVAHIAADFVASSIAASLVAQVVGAIFVAFIIHRLKPVPGVLAVVAGYIAIIAIFKWETSGTQFFIATLLFGFLWSIAMALFLPLLIEADPSRHSAMFLSGTMLLGSSAGPFLAGAFASETKIEPALVVATALFLLSAAFCLISTRLHRGRAQ